MLTYAEFTQLRDHASTLDSLCAVESHLGRSQVRIAGGQQEDAQGRLVSEEYFSVLGVDPAIGALLQPHRTPRVREKTPMPSSVMNTGRSVFGGNVSVLGTPYQNAGRHAHGDRRGPRRDSPAKAWATNRISGCP